METNRDDLDALAAELQIDLDNRVPRRVFVEGRGPGSLVQAYQLQRALRRFRETRGERVVGFKIGYTSATVRKNSATFMGLSESVHGYLWDSESYPVGATVDHRRLGIEGELGIRLVDAEGDDVSQWEVDYEPVVELHGMGMDGPESDNQGRRGFELIGTNCIHVGVVHARETKRSLLGDIPLNAPMTVHIGGDQIEQLTLKELEINRVFGPVGTVNWLLQTLRAEGNGEEALLTEGTTIICSTPGGLHPVPPATQVRVEFNALVTTCVADD